jgi:putative transposase
MARELRIEFPGAFYHVTSRGNQKRPVFLSDDDRHFFLRCLAEAHARFGSLIHAYCIMENHYHLFIETPHGNLSRIIHLVNTTYSVYFNRKWNRSGHPFQGRYKAILVQAEQYARELVPYIHLNPVRRGLVDQPEKYSWSNYREYLGVTTSRPWTRTSLVLSYFGNHLTEARRRYTEYVIWRLHQSLASPLKAAKSSGILGDSEFIDRIKKTSLPDALDVPDRELPRLRKPEVKPDLRMVIAAAEKALGPKNRLIKKVSIFVSHKNTSYTLKELAEFFHMSISAISEASRKTKKDLCLNQTLLRAISEIESQISSQMEGGVKPTLYREIV